MAKIDSTQSSNDPDFELRAAAGFNRSKASVMHLEAAREQVEAAQRDLSSVYGAHKEC